MKLILFVAAAAFASAYVPCLAQVGERGFPVVDAKTQAVRDADRRAILQGELMNEQANLNAANATLAEAKKSRLQAAAIADAEASVHRHEQNLAMLRREIAGGVSTTVKNPKGLTAKSREGGLSSVSRLTRASSADSPAAAWDTWGRRAASKAPGKADESRDSPIILRASTAN